MLQVPTGTNAIRFLGLLLKEGFLRTCLTSPLYKRALFFARPMFFVLLKRNLSPNK